MENAPVWSKIAIKTVLSLDQWSVINYWNFELRSKLILINGFDQLHLFCFIRDSRHFFEKDQAFKKIKDKF